MDRNNTARGVGISLPVHEGGHTFALEEHHRCRFKLIQADLTYYRLGPASHPHAIQGKELLPLPLAVRLQTFDVVLLDGHHLRTQPKTREWDWDRLLISQIIIALQAVKRGGTIVIKLGNPERFNIAILLLMLDFVSSSVQTCKPQTIHGLRGTFYAVAKGVGEGREAGRLPEILESLRQLWLDLTVGGEEGVGRFMTRDDLNFVMTDAELFQDQQLDRLIELSRGVWNVQAHALRNWMRKRARYQYH